MMRRAWEFLFLVTVAAGISITTSSFTMMSGLFALAGVWTVVLAIVLAGLACMVISATMGELASLYPSSPGIRTYLRMAFGDHYSLAMVFLYMCVLFLIAGVESYVFALVIKATFGDIPTHFLVLAILSFTLLINLQGLQLPRLMQMVTTCILIALFVGVGWYGFLSAPDSLSRDAVSGLPDLKGLQHLPALVGMSIFLFLGFEWVTPLGRDPSFYRRLIPLSMPLALGINILVNGSFALGMGHSLTQEQVAGQTLPQLLFFSHLFGPSSLYLALGMAILASFSTFNAGLMGSSRLFYALAREGNLPAWFASIWSRNGLPLGATLFVSVVTAAIALVVVVFELELIASIIAASLVCMVYGSIMLSLILLRKRGKTAGATFRSPFPIWLQWIFVVAMPALGILSLLSDSEGKAAILWGSLLLAIGAVLFAYWSESGKKRRNNTRSKRSAFQAPSMPLTVPTENSHVSRKA